MLLYLTVLAASLANPCPDSLAALSGTRAAPAGVGGCTGTDTIPRKRPKAIELSGAYETRLTIHKWASYTTIPIFVGQALVGEKLYSDDEAGRRPSQGMRAAHDGLAVALGALFVVNTVTGSLNWWETRAQTGGRTWRTIHAALMLASDAGFAYTAALAPGDRNDHDSRTQHKNWAIGSASVALAGYAMMLWPIRRD